MTALTDVGLVRELNEDNYRLVPNRNLAIVCDGMGGHAAGEVASQFAVDTIAEAMSSSVVTQPVPADIQVEKDYGRSGAMLVNAIRLANRRIYLQSARDSMLRGMGTTVVATLFEDEYVIVCHVGDSRVYRYRNGNLEQLTVDHSWVNELINSKQLTEEESKNFVSKNVITRALGTREKVKVDIRQDRVAKDDIYLLCSDGLCGFVSDADILRSISRADAGLDRIAQELVERANGAGGEDNITVSLVQVIEAEEVGEFEKELMQMTVEEESDEDLGREDEILEKLFPTVQSSQTAKISTRPLKVAHGKRWPIGWILLAGVLVLAIIAYLGYTYDIADFKSKVNNLVSHIRGQPPDITDVTPGTIDSFHIEPGMTFIQFKGFPDSLLDYTFFVDKTPVGTVRQYLTDKLGIDPGYHSLQLKNDSGVLLANMNYTFKVGDLMLTFQDFKLIE